MKIMLSKNEAGKVLELITAMDLQNEKVTEEIKIQAAENGEVEVEVDADFLIKTIEIYKTGVKSFKAILSFIKLHLDLIKDKAEALFPPTKVEDTENKKEEEEKKEETK